MADTSNAQIGSKTKIYYWDKTKSPAEYTAFPNVRSFGELKATKPRVGSTDLDSNAEEYIPGLGDGQPNTLTCVDNTVTRPLLKGFYDDGENIDIKMLDPAPSSQSLYCSLTPLELSFGTIEAGALRVVSLGFSVSGDITDEDPHGA